MKFALLAILLLVAGSQIWTSGAEAFELRGRRCPPNRSTNGASRSYGSSYASTYGWNWHGDYYHTAWGTPVALVVPPTAQYQTNWGWGVGNTRMSRISQFQRPWPGPYAPGPGFRPTPNWPSDTDQFGVYYVRGPW